MHAQVEESLNEMASLLGGRCRRGGRSGVMSNSMCQLYSAKVSPLFGPTLGKVSLDGTNI